MTRSVGKLLTLIEHVLLDTTYPTPSNVIDNDNCILGFEIKKPVLNDFALLFATSNTAFKNAYKAIKVEIEKDVPYLRNHAKFTFLSLQARSSTGSPLSQFLYPPSGSGPPHGPPPPPGASAAASSDPMASPPPAHVGAYLDKGEFSTQGYQLWTFYVQKWKSCHSISDIPKANAIFPLK